MTFDLQRFLDAQAPVLGDVEAELRAGRKRTHWMWFIFPQLRGLGHSEMARVYGLDGLAEAQAYLDHPVLGPRLREHVGLVLKLSHRTAHAIFGSPDDLKFRSCLTLFNRAAQGDDKALFSTALASFYGGEPDTKTLSLLEARP